MKFYHNYVCEPNRFHITAEKEKHTAKGIRLKFFIRNKLVLSFTHTLNTYNPTEDDINAHVARCCTFIKETTENFIQDKIDGDYIMGALNFHRFLCKTYTKAGKVIWTTKD